jgi:hypothetical protein
MSRELEVAGVLLQNKWYWSDDECLWSGDRPFALREQAIEDARNHEIGYFFTGCGESINLDEVMISVHEVVDSLSEKLANEIGEAADGWLSNISDEVEKDLENELYATINGWLTRNDRTLKYFRIVDVQCHKIDKDGKLVSGNPFS